MKYLALLIITCTILITGCSRTNEYTPAPGASAEQIFKNTCGECHHPLRESEPDILYELAKNMVNKDSIKAKISGGSFLMPKFPNIQGDALNSLSDYVLAYSKAK